MVLVKNRPSVTHLKATRSDDETILVGGVFSLTGQEVARQLGRGPTNCRVSALVRDADLMSMVMTDEKRTLAADNVFPLLVGEANVNATTDTVVIATDSPPPPEAIQRILLDAIARHCQTAILLSRSPPSSDVSLWRLAEDAAIGAAAEGLVSLTILRTAEAIGGPYYAQNADLLKSAAAKSVTSNHRNFGIEAVGSKTRLAQQDFGTSREIIGKVVEKVLAVQREKSRKRAEGDSSKSAVEVSILDVISIEGGEPDNDVAIKRVADALEEAATSNAATNTNESPSSSSLPFSDASALWFLTEPQVPKSTNPFLAPAAVSGPYWFAVILAAVGFGLAAQGWTWCQVPWAVDPKSPFHVKTTEQTCTCRDTDTFRGCEPVGALQEGSFRYLNRVVNR